MFVTAWMGRLDLKSGLLEYVNAGHNPPLIRHRDGGAEYLRTRPNFILAGMDMTRYKKHELSLAPGDVLFLYTDGVTEAADHEDALYGEERLRDTLSQAGKDPADICREVHSDVAAFVNGAEQSDDITMLCVRWNEKEKTADFSARPEKDSIEKASAFLEETMETWEVPMKLSNRAQIAVDEVYSNIVYYSGADLARITVSFDGDTLTLLFEDDGKPYDPLSAEEPDVTIPLEDRNVGGLGIFMVKKLAAEMTYRYENTKNELKILFTK